MKTTFEIQGMNCDHCARHVREAIEKLPGVQSATVSLAEKRAVVTHDETVAPQAIVAAVDAAGYTASLP